MIQEITNIEKKINPSDLYSIDNITKDGRISFTFKGEGIQELYEVSITDDNTNLVVYKTKLPLTNGTSWFITTGESNAKKLKSCKFTLIYGGISYETKINLFGENRYVVVDDEKIDLKNMGDSLFPIVCEIFYDKIYERDYVRVELNDIVVDVGANYGVFSLYSQKFKPKKVFALEPIKTTYGKMVDNLKRYGVICINKAIGDKDGYETFAITDVNGNNFSHNNSDAYHPSQVIGSETVETTTFNTFLLENKIKHIDFLKVDCEGGELHLFENIDKEFLSKNIKKIAIEYHSKKIFNFLIETLTKNNFIIEDTAGFEDIGMIYAYNKFFFN